MQWFKQNVMKANRTDKKVPIKWYRFYLIVIVIKCKYYLRPKIMNNLNVWRFNKLHSNAKISQPNNVPLNYAFWCAALHSNFTSPNMVWLKLTVGKNLMINSCFLRFFFFICRNEYSTVIEKKIKSLIIWYDKFLYLTGKMCDI